MPIDDDAVGIVKWGTGAGASNFNTPADVGFAEADGWPLAYGTPGSGSEPQREVFNWQWRRLTALAVELLTHGGGLPWDSRISYLHPASVMGSDGMLYQSVQDSTNQDPTTDTSDTDWQQVGITLSDTDIKTAYERNADTNALTDALLTRLQGAAPLASPSFSGAVTVPDQTAGTNNARAANTRFVAAALAALLVSPAFTNDPTAPTQTAGNDSTRLATTAFVQAALAALVASAPATLDTLNELAAALGDDPNFATTIMTLLGQKADAASPVFTGNPQAPTPSAGDDDTSIATTQFVDRAFDRLDSDVQFFTASGTWLKPAGAKAVHIFLLHAGGGHNLTNGGRNGGGSAQVQIGADRLPSTVSVTVGAGGLNRQKGGKSSFGDFASGDAGSGVTFSSAQNEGIGGFTGGTNAGHNIGGGAAGVLSDGQNGSDGGIAGFASLGGNGANGNTPAGPGGGGKLAQTTGGDGRVLVATYL